MTYPNAPIREAVIDIRAPSLKGIAREDLSSFTESVKDEYPDVELVRTMMVQVNSEPASSPEISTSTNDSASGFFAVSAAKSPGGTPLSSYRVDSTGFNFGRHFPYNDWRDMKKQAQKLWTIYEQIAKPGAVNRLGLRYINRIDIPLSTEQIDMSDWLNVAVNVPDDNKWQMNYFYFQIHIPINKLDAMSVINCAPAKPDKSNHLSFLLDIDVFKIFQGDSKVDIWDFFDELREQKNYFFESALTERTKELFK
jgi:uncharacterized protein (TIGR04255 family)